MNELMQFNLTYWFLQAVAMTITAILLPNLRITSIFGAFLIVVSLAFVNSKVWDAALFFHIPDTFSYHSILLFLTNGLIFWILVKLLPGIEIDGFLSALVAPIVFTFTSILISKYYTYVDWIGLLEHVINFLQGIRDYFQKEVPLTPVNPILATPTVKP